MILALTLSLASLHQDPAPQQSGEPPRPVAETPVGSDGTLADKHAELQRVRAERKEALRLKIIRLEAEIEKTKQELARLDKWFPTSKVVSDEKAGTQECEPPACNEGECKEGECDCCGKAKEAVNETRARARHETGANDRVQNTAREKETSRTPPRPKAKRPDTL